MGVIKKMFYENVIRRKSFGYALRHFHCSKMYKSLDII
jgi:hypothetical protein